MQVSISKNTHPGRHPRLVQLPMLLMSITLLASCTKEKIAIKEYPRLKTLEVTNITPEGATFNGEMFFGDLTEVEKVGFVWGDSKSINNESADTTVISGPITKASFQKKVSHSLASGVIYCVMAFAITDKYTSYGPPITFKSMGSKAPVITDFYPSQGNSGDTITIIGDNFSNRPEKNTVLVGNMQVLVIRAEKTRISFVLPTTSLTGDVSIKVTVASMITEATGIFKFNVPGITSLEPQSRVIGKGDITLTGKGFSPDISK